jgi:steroid 5-alpha reductase family enzyme
MGPIGVVTILAGVFCIYAWFASLITGDTSQVDRLWSIVRARMKRWQFQLFNLFFIVLYQNFILVLITMPALIAYNHQSTKLSIVDWLLVTAISSVGPFQLLTTSELLL